MPGGGKGSHALTSGGGKKGAFSCPLRGKDVRRTERGLHLWNAKTLITESNQQAFFINSSAPFLTRGGLKNTYIPDEFMLYGGKSSIL
jgi:hypothetical protein